ncbi:hypothetical protein CkaCkLH20_08928 [Colletotrichum karsti]|uniref:Uncharacterized protein n=1 Tax=Colletotrichum karsti TaxID=1095194 RepID=A0A9P6HZF2_9PEZI|nr:uncharacterized protein CkaCkLH20_08928 [Colletotrichum karsti]KAF9873469.1 hypothetical protein CkaCkLH20_08928 [Colletotrichum karsti]
MSTTSSSTAKQAFSLQKLRDALPGKPGPSSMPYEIFLKIFDALVAEAEEDSEPILHWTTINPDTPGHLLLMDQKDYDRPGAPQEKRFAVIGNLLKIDSRSRRHIQATAFRPVEMMFRVGMDDAFVAVGWICPSVDRFMPWTGEKWKIPTLKKLMLNPTPDLVYIVSAMRSIQVNVTELFRYTYVKDFQDMLKLANLDDIAIRGGLKITAPAVKPQDRHNHTDLLPIDPLLLPELAQWARKYGNSLLKKVWPEMKERGIRLFVSESDKVDIDILELFYTPDGIRMRFLDPVCRCYKFHIPDSMKPGGVGRLKGKARKLAKGGRA